jgi:hypothetical protein
MSGRPNLITVFTQCTRDNWYATGIWLFFTVCLGFLPFWIGLIWVKFSSRDAINWADFLVHGELAMYSAALLSPCLRLITRDSARGIFVHRQMFSALCLIGMMFSIVLYCFVKATTQLKGADGVNVQFMTQTSLPLLVVTLLFAALVFFVDQQRQNPDPEASSREQVTNLADKVRALRRTSHDDNS